MIDLTDMQTIQWLLLGIIFALVIIIGQLRQIVRQLSLTPSERRSQDQGYRLERDEPGPLGMIFGFILLLVLAVGGIFLTFWWVLPRLKYWLDYWL
jgi:ABC-type Fe3+ transport system permease subunit